MLLRSKFSIVDRQQITNLRINPRHSFSTQKAKSSICIFYLKRKSITSGGRIETGQAEALTILLILAGLLVVRQGALKFVVTYMTRQSENSWLGRDTLSFLDIKAIDE